MSDNEHRFYFLDKDLHGCLQKLCKGELIFTKEVFDERSRKYKVYRRT